MIMIMLQGVCVLYWLILLSLELQDSKYGETFNIIAWIVFGLMDTVLQGTLLYVYNRAQTKYVSSYYDHEFFDKYKEENTKQHERILDMSRYTVVFGILCILVTSVMSVVQLIIAVNAEEIFPHINSYNMVAFTYFSVRDILSLIALYLSFPWSHAFYEKLCGCCHQRVKDWCDFKTNLKNKGYHAVWIKNYDPPLLVQLGSTTSTTE